MLLTSQDEWVLPPANLVLSNDDVHIWRASLKRTASDLDALRRTLSADELDRAARFHFQKDRESFIAARGLLRTILSRYLPGAAPNRLRFRYHPQGKPALESVPGHDSLQFNLSHSHELALYAIARDRQVGIDLEHIREDVEIALIAARNFSRDEVSALQTLPEELRQEAFFNCWARKEAYLKAQGEGLSLPLDQFAVTLAPDQPARLLHTHYHPPEAARWSIRPVMAGPRYAGALVVEGHDWQLSCWQWPETG